MGVVNEAMTNRKIWELYGNCADSTLEMVSNCANLQHKSSTRSKGQKESSRSFGFFGRLVLLIFCKLNLHNGWKCSPTELRPVFCAFFRLGYPGKTLHLPVLLGDGASQCINKYIYIIYIIYYIIAYYIFYICVI